MPKLEDGFETFWLPSTSTIPYHPPFLLPVLSHGVGRGFIIGLLITNHTVPDNTISQNFNLYLLG